VKRAMRDYRLIKETALILSHLAKQSCLSPHATGGWLRLGPSSSQLLSSFSSAANQSNGDTTTKNTTHSDIDIKESPFNIPNSLSLARGASGPFIAYLILSEQWPTAIALTAVSGATDWLDGYLARRYNQSGVLGSYLDPLGDKLLIGSLVTALAYKGLIPLWVASVILGRDLALVGGLVYLRYRALKESKGRGERPRGPITFSEFTRTRAASAPSVVDSDSKDGTLVIGAGAMPMMQPLFISKVNTVLQLALIGGSLSHAWVAWPDASSLKAVEVVTAGTTALTCAAYAQKALFRRAKP
jgi:cardiolipin synthase